MKFKKLKLYTNKLESELDFYSKKLGFKIIEQTQKSFSLKVGWTELEFEESSIAHIYHYCFLIPSTMFNHALKWMDKRIEVIEIENDRKTQKFESWNAESFYFYDGSGNLAECIAHYDLKSVEKTFNISKVLAVCEIGMPNNSINLIDKQLSKNLKTKFWKGDFERFGTNGSIEGKFLLPNYKIKKTWFPTSLQIMPQDFEVCVLNKNEEFVLEFKNGEIKITSKNSNSCTNT